VTITHQACRAAKCLFTTIAGAATVSVTSWMLDLIPIGGDKPPDSTTPSQPSGHVSLHIVRFVGGVILDAAEAVLIDLYCTRAQLFTQKFCAQNLVS